MGNSKVRKKNSFAHKVLAEVTLESNEKLVQGLRDMIEQNHLLEENRMQLERQMFNDYMQYKKDRDLDARENSRMSLFNQQLLIQAINNSLYRPSAASPLSSRRPRQRLQCFTMDLQLKLHCHHRIHQPKKHRFLLETTVIS
jgi:hypothetical protein